MADVDSRHEIELSDGWQLVFDPAGEGIAAGWMAGAWPERRSQSVSLPSLWNFADAETAQIGFYRRIITIPADWDGRSLHLAFTGVSYRMDAWLNGAFLGRHDGGYTPFSFELGAAAQVGAANELVIRVVSLSRTEAVEGMHLEQTPAAKQSWYYIEAGLWGAVHLQARPRLSCHAIKVEPDLRNERVQIELAMRNDDREAQPAELNLQITAPDDGAIVASIRSDLVVLPGISDYTYRIDIPRPQAWSCELPRLYQASASITRHGEETDRLGTAFGMRDFSVRDGQFFLNGEPIFLRGILLQPNYPVNLIAPPTPDMMRHEIMLMKDAGFNLLRAHVRPSPPGYLDIADELGMLVYAESTLAWIRDSPRMLGYCRRETRALIERDYNHPSVVIWGINNENRAVNALIGDALIREARSIDSTRVLVDNSGGSFTIDQDYGWIDRATVVDNRATVREEIQDIHLYVGAPVPAGIYEWLRTIGAPTPAVDVSSYGFSSPEMVAEWQRELDSYRGKIFVSELGCGGMADLDSVLAGFGDQLDLQDAQEIRAFRDSLYDGFAERGLDRIFGSVPELVAASQALQAVGNTRQIEAIIANPRVSGYCLTQLNDVAWEFHAGILDHWRKPKQVYEAVRRLNQPHNVILKSHAPLVNCGGRVEVDMTVVDQTSAHPGRHLEVRILGPDGDELATERRDVPAGPGIKALRPVSFTADGKAGEYRVTARLCQDDTVLADSYEPILALPTPDWTSVLPDITWLGDGSEMVATAISAARAGSSPALERQAELTVAPIPGSLDMAQWDKLLAAVNAGATAVIGPLRPKDQLAHTILTERGLRPELHFGIGNWMGCYHWIPASPMFENVPNGGLATEAYADVLPRYTLSELGGESLAGSFNNTQTRREAPAMLWYSDIEVVRFGAGTLYFCQYRIFDDATNNPLAGRLLSNLLNVAVASRHKEGSGSHG